MYRFYTKNYVQPPGCIPVTLLTLKLSNLISKADKRKWIMRANITTLILISAIMQVAASGFAQKVTLTAKNIRLEKVFEQINTQTGYDFLFTRKTLKDANLVNANFKDAELKEVLDQLFKGQPLEYTIEDKSVVVSAKSPSFLERLVDLFNNIDVRGRVVDSTGNPLPGATVQIKGTNRSVKTSESGGFSFADVKEDAVLVISYIGFDSKEIAAAKELGDIPLAASTKDLAEVNVVSTGYQLLPKERATGSFVLVDSALLNRKIGANILDRLDGITSGVYFNRTKTFGTEANISIRGRSTLTSSTAPLVILDNFPYDGEISNINPLEVKSISILKDAAAASIWGSRAGNGVIVITTHKGRFNQKPEVSFTANVSVGGKPDVFYLPQLTNRQFIDVEQFLFDQLAYNGTINNGYAALSPAVEIMKLYRDSKINLRTREVMLDSLALHDNRDDLDKYYYRKSVAQQYQLSVRGGGPANKYSISMGYDKSLASVPGSGNDRLTLNANNTISFINNKLELFTGVMFSVSSAMSNFTNYNPQSPYENIADLNGNPLPVARVLRLPYVDTAGKGKLLDWHYRPLEEIRTPLSTNKNTLTDYRVSLGLNYKILAGLKFGISYTYDKGINDQEQFNTLDSWYLRDMINQYTQINSVTGALKYQVPFGDLVSKAANAYYSHYGRGQFNYDKNFDKFAISAIAGYEIKDYRSNTSGVIFYGYNKETDNNQNSIINPQGQITSYYGFGSTKISPNTISSGTIDRYRSYFFNGSITYDNRFVFGGSVRRDESNLFGVKTNQKGVPLWSAGLVWNLNNEAFYHVDFIPYLKLRATYGYSGNVNKSISAYLTGSPNSGFSNNWGKPYLSIQNPPNPALRWEQVKTVNLGLDFQSKNNILSGSVEYWTKSGLDLIGESPIAQQTGVSTFTGNTANMMGKGVDVLINSKNLKINAFKWTSNFQFNYNTDKITDYKVQNQNNGSIVNRNYFQPLIGYSYYSLFSYKWMGLDETGNPQSVLNGTISKNYSGISNSLNNSELVYSGTVSPKYFGNLLNSVSWKSLEVSINLVYRAGYVFRRPTLDGSILYSIGNVASRYRQPEYEMRWQKAGDEVFINVPALTYPTNSIRDAVYTNSDIAVEKADNVRLQDIRLNYTVSRKTVRNLPFATLNIYSYISNLGVIWKATKYDVDPDYKGTIPLPKTFAVGLKADF